MDLLLNSHILGSSEQKNDVHPIETSLEAEECGSFTLRSIDLTYNTLHPSEIVNEIFRLIHFDSRYIWRKIQRNIFFSGAIGIIFGSLELCAGLGFRDVLSNIWEFIQVSLNVSH